MTPRSNVNPNNLETLRREMRRLMEEHLESLKKQAFLSDQEQRKGDLERLGRIREVSADYLALLEKTHTRKEGAAVTEKPSVKLPGRVEKIIDRGDGEPEKAEILIDAADPLYREIRIENSLTDSTGNEVHLKENDEVDVTVEAGKDGTKADESESRKKKSA